MVAAVHMRITFRLRNGQGQGSIALWGKGSDGGIREGVICGSTRHYLQVGIHWLLLLTGTSLGDRFWKLPKTPFTKWIVTGNGVHSSFDWTQITEVLGGRFWMRLNKALPWYIALNAFAIGCRQRIKRDRVEVTRLVVLGTFSVWATQMNAFFDSVGAQFSLFSSLVTK